MHHIAIMKPQWKLIDKLLSGEKRIESRWYMTRRAPWGVICAGDTVFFKDSGMPVTVKATVSRIVQEELTPAKVRTLVDKYGGSGGIALSSKEQSIVLYEMKRYCILIFLKDAQRISPLVIAKKGYGNAWFTVSNIRELQQ